MYKFPIATIAYHDYILGFRATKYKDLLAIDCRCFRSEINFPCTAILAYAMKFNIDAINIDECKINS